MRILLTGSKGMLGKDLSRVFASAGHEVLETDRSELDITQAEQVMSFVSSCNPDIIINAAAYNFVDLVESDEHYPVAYAVNADGPKHLAIAAKAVGIPFFTYSTDYVFAGDRPDGYVETDITRPISRYGETKLAGEQAVQSVGGRYYILRTSKLFGSPGVSDQSKKSFAALMLDLAAKLPELSIVDEEVGSPTYTMHLAQHALQMVSALPEPGIYHVVNEGPGVTWYAFANEIFELAAIDPKRTPVPSSAFPRAAKAPDFAALRNTKTQPLPDRREAIEQFLKEIGVLS